MSPRKTAALFTGLLVLSAASLLFALKAGSLPLAWGELLPALTGGGESLSRQILLELRLPRAVGAFAIGGTLALAGALMQVLLRNPLADPYVLGISGGAAVALLAGTLLGVTGVMLDGLGFAGALFSMLLVFGLARGGGAWTPARLLLTGVVVAAGWGAIISLLLALSPDAMLRGMLFWLMGDLAWHDRPFASLAVLLAGLVVCVPLARDMNLLARGELQAAALGAPAHATQIALYFIASLLTAAAVSAAGSIGFVGLIVPHLVRLIAGGDHRVLLPAAVLLGGSLLTAADTLARSVLAPQQLPVGVLTALLGVPVFLFLLSRNPR